MKQKVFPEITYLDEVDSTNTYLKHLALSGVSEGTVVIAKAQSMGRGRLGRSFFSKGGIGIYMSILLRPRLRLQDASLLTCMAAVAVARSLDAHSSSKVGIKWVNDIYIDGKKVCGILTEGAADNRGNTAFAIVGIGINLCAPDGGFPPDLKDVAGALFSDKAIAQKAYPIIVDSLLDEFFSMYTALPSQSFTHEYASRSILIGKQVMLTQGGQQRPCHVLGVNQNCHLLVRYEDGTEEAVFYGEAVSLSNKS